MRTNIEHTNYNDSDRMAMLETRAAELEDMLAGIDPERAAPRSGGRTESLIRQGRANAARGRMEFFRSHWKALSLVAGAVAVAVGVLAAVTTGSAPAAWPASVTTMQAQIEASCRNPNVAAEPSQFDFACGKDTRQVLWVFALLTSGGNPGYVDAATGRKGLEPIAPSQGGNVAWSLNLHAPYDPTRPGDSIQVAARALNNIMAGATLTGSDGQPQVQGGLESSAANCARYTGSRRLRTRPGYPALCADPLTAAGQAALVSDAFRQWMTDAPAQTAADAGILFAHADDPGNPQVREILASLPGAGR